MAIYKGDNFIDRMSVAANAKRATLERFRARPGPNDPTVVERQAARQAVSNAREARAAARHAARHADAVRQAAEEAARVAEQAAGEAEEARRAAEQAACNVTLEAGCKAARDARYAARKARR
jgi:hypothetical protein